jgi:hypothetical protein
MEEQDFICPIVASKAMVTISGCRFEAKTEGGVSRIMSNQ